MIAVEVIFISYWSATSKELCIKIANWRCLFVLLVSFVVFAVMSRKKANEETDKLTRIAIVNADRCKPKRCRQECKKSCPVVRMGKLCIEVTPNDKIATISEELCIGCGICVKVCEIVSLLPLIYHLKLIAINYLVLMFTNNWKYIKISVISYYINCTHMKKLHYIRLVLVLYYNSSSIS